MEPFNPITQFEPEVEAVTAEERASIYSSAMDSVALITDPAEDQEKTPDERKKDIERNVQHLELIVSKPFWQGEDLTPFINAISIGKTALSA